MAKQQQLEICKVVQEGFGQSMHSNAMASHKGRDSTYSKISQGFFWYSVYKDAEPYIKSSECCQEQSDLKLKTNSKRHSIPVSSKVTKQVGVDLCGLPLGCPKLVDIAIVCIDYFSKWSAAKPTTEKIGPTIAQFLYQMMCRHMMALRSKSMTRAES